MVRMSEVPEREDWPADQPEQRPRLLRRRSVQAKPTRRALLLTALGGLLVAGLFAALPISGYEPGRLARFFESSPAPGTGTHANGTFKRANSGDCLTWPDGTPDGAAIVDCPDEHRFEVAESIDMSTFPGTEYGPDAEPPSAARIQQISQEQCEVAVHRYLGPRYDPHGKFTISMLWSGDKAWQEDGERTMLCGLQLPGADNKQIAFKDKVADIDQSKVWPAGTCLGIDPSTNQPTDIPVDCSAPHAMEVTGAVNLAEEFPGPLPAEPDQDGFIKDACTQMTDTYLEPVRLRDTTLTLIYSTISLPSWSAGSHQVACSIGATLGNGGWATLLNSAKTGPLLINGQPPVPPPDIPEERLNQQPDQVPDQSTGTSQTTQTGQTGQMGQSGQSQQSQSQQSQSGQHLPQQTATPNTPSPEPEPPPPPPEPPPPPPPAPWLPPWLPPPPPPSEAPPPGGPPPGPVEPPPGG